MCCKCVGKKKHDGKIYRRVCLGEAGKRQGEFCISGWILFTVGNVGCGF
jgi:hypothetical protein